MSRRFYALNGIDEVNLRQAYMNSLPEPLCNETTRILSLKNMVLNSASIGEIYPDASDCYWGAVLLEEND